MKVVVATQQQPPPAAAADDYEQVQDDLEDKLRRDIDTLLDENLELRIKFSSSLQRVQELQSKDEGLQRKLQLINSEDAAANKQQDGSTEKQLRALKMELQVWTCGRSEQNAMLRGELQCRFTSLRHPAGDRRPSVLTPQHAAAKHKRVSDESCRRGWSTSRGSRRRWSGRWPSCTTTTPPDRQLCRRSRQLDSYIHVQKKGFSFKTGTST